MNLRLGWLHPLGLRLVAMIGIAGCLLCLTALSAQPADWAPVTSGPLGEVNARDGDRAFNTDYFAGAAATGTALVSRLEAVVGAESPPSALAGPAYAVRWSGTLTPSTTGFIALSLRSSGEAVLRLDGKVLLQNPSKRFDARATHTMSVQAGRPYELEITFHHRTPGERIAVEWSPAEAPAAVVPAGAPAAPVEIRVGPAPGATLGEPALLENATYRARVDAHGNFTLTEKATGAEANFLPEFIVIHPPAGQEMKMDAKGGKYADDGPVGDTNYVVPSWDKETDFFVAAHTRARLRADRMALQDRTLRWEFPAQPDYRLSAVLELPGDGREPALTFTLTPTTAGQFSVGYAGAPALASTATDWIWQPLVWQDHRFPNRAYLTKEFECPLPFAMLGVGGVSVGVGADTREMPFRMPTISDSRFGVLIRNAAGQAQPQLFAPLPGGRESAMRAGQPYTFRLRLVTRRGPWFDTYRQLARGLYDFRDVRENGLCSLNTTIDNLMDYLLRDEFVYWYPRYKTWGYQNDGGPGAGRQQSAADAVALALVCDHAEFFDRRARPTVEYMLSRNTVSINFTEPKFLGGFVNSPSDLSATYRLTGGRTTVLKDRLLAQPAAGPESRKPGHARRSTIFTDKNTLTQSLAYYRLTGDPAYLHTARTAADRYIAQRIDRPAESFGDLSSSFWPEVAPSYDVLYELYEETGEKRYLAAAAAAMKQFTGYIYLVPAIPAGNFTANPGGRYNGQPVPEEIVPAWRVAANGLAAECAGTAHSHRGVFMVSYAGYLARLSRDTQEPFFRDIARHAIVGRYANYPSYAYRNGYSTVYEKPNHPLRSFEEMKKFTSAHYNHPLPMTAFLIDYLVSDFYARSDAAIQFPSDFTHTGAYFRNKVYGARPGRFYDQTDASLWLPRGLLTMDSIQLNHLAARGRDGRFYLAFANQSDRPVTATVQLNADRVRLDGADPARQWIDGQAGPPLPVKQGRFTVTVSPKGLTALAFSGAHPRTEIQEAMLDPTSPALPTGAERRFATDLGAVQVTPLRFGRGLTSLHVWIQAKPDAFRQVTLRLPSAGEPAEFVSREFPYEFTVPLDDAHLAPQMEITAVTADGRTVRPAPLTVALGQPPGAP